MPTTISNDVIRQIYSICGNHDFPVEEYCIGCENCECYGFPCANCAYYVFGERLGPGERGQADSGGSSDMEIDEGIDDVPEPRTPTSVLERQIPVDSTDDDISDHLLPHKFHESSWRDDEPVSPTKSEESVTSPAMSWRSTLAANLNTTLPDIPYDIDPESPLGLLLQHCKN